MSELCHHGLPHGFSVLQGWLPQDGDGALQRFSLDVYGVPEAPEEKREEEWKR